MVRGGYPSSGRRVSELRPPPTGPATGALIHPIDRWEPWHVAVLDGRGPERVVYDQPHPGFMRRYTGFAAPAVEVEPLLWEGDDS